MSTESPNKLSLPASTKDATNHIGPISLDEIRERAIAFGLRFKSAMDLSADGSNNVDLKNVGGVIVPVTVDEVRSRARDFGARFKAAQSTFIDYP